MILSKYRIAIIALVIAALIWGMSAPIFKWSLAAVSPFTFIFIRFFLASLLLLPFTMHRLTIKRKDIPKLIMLAFVGFILHIPTIFIGLTLAPSINASIIATSSPIFLLFASFFILKERIKRKVLFGTIISILGILFIILQPVIEAGFDGSLIGNLLFVVSMFSFVLYTILLKEFNLPYSPLTLTFWVFALATISFFPMFLVENAGAPLYIPPQGLIGILFGAIFTSNLAYLLFNFAVKHIHASEVGMFLYIDPIVTALVAMPLLGEQITAAFIAGSVLVFAGIFIAEGRIHYHPLHKLKKSISTP